MAWLQSLEIALMGLYGWAHDAYESHNLTPISLIIKGIATLFQFAFHLAQLVIAHKIAQHPLLAQVIGKIIHMLNKH